MSNFIQWSDRLLGWVDIQKKQIVQGTLRGKIGQISKYLYSSIAAELPEPMVKKLARISGKKTLFYIVNENEEIEVKLAHHSQHSPQRLEGI